MLSKIADVIGMPGLTGLLALTITGLVILALYIKKLHKEIKDIQEKRIADKDEQNKIMFEFIEKRVESEIKQSEAFRSLKIVIEKLIEKL